MNVMCVYLVRDAGNSCRKKEIIKKKKKKIDHKKAQQSTREKSWNITSLTAVAGYKEQKKKSVNWI